MKKLIVPILITIISFPIFADQNKQERLSFKTFAEAVRSNNASQKTLIKFLSNPNPEEIEFGIRFSAKSCYKFNAEPVYKAIWNNNKKAFPSLNINYLRQPIILLSVAGALSILNEGKNNQQYQYIQKQLNLKNKKTLPFAILALGKVGAKKDIQTLINLAKFNNGEYLFPSAFSILEIDRVAGTQALKKLQKEFGENTKNANKISSILSEK